MRTLRLVGREEGKINIKEKGVGRRDAGHRQGRLSVVGIGPGDSSHLTAKARDAISKCQVIVGYNTYIKLLGDLVFGKEIISSGMAQEVERAAQAIERAREGKKVCLVSSGDPGIYGMAGVVLELLNEREKKLEVEVIPGVMAATACAASLGAPLMHDFAVISLSDILTDQKEIEKKLRASAEADFIIALYNPRSKTRAHPLKKAWEILLKYRSPETPVGIVRNAERSGQDVRVITLKGAPFLENIDMVTTIIVGNSKTYIKGRHMITPRGYDLRKVRRVNGIRCHRDKPQDSAC